MDCAAEVRDYSQIIDWKTGVVFGNITPARRLETMTGLAGNFDRREHTTPRGEMENRIKEQQLDLCADRTSTHWVSSNQLRLWLSTFAYIPMNACRILGIKGTIFARAQCGSIRSKLMKIGTAIKFNVERIAISYAIDYPWAKEFCRIHRNVYSIPLQI